MNAFKSGRFYSEHGQRIAWTPIKEGDCVAFIDIDRHISGIIPYGCVSNQDVMNAYDAGDYIGGLYGDEAYLKPLLEEAANAL